MIADPKVVVVTETINSKEKMKLRWSIFNLEKNKTAAHLFPVGDKKFNGLPCYNNTATNNGKTTAWRHEIF